MSRNLPYSTAMLISRADAMASYAFGRGEIIKDEECTREYRAKFLDDMPDRPQITMPFSLTAHMTTSFPQIAFSKMKSGTGSSGSEE